MVNISCANIFLPIKIFPRRHNHEHCGRWGRGGRWLFRRQVSRSLTIHPGVELLFYSPGPHLASIRAPGLILDTDEGVNVCQPTLATDDFQELPSLDFCLVGVKGYDLDRTLRFLRPRVHQGAVLPACVYVGTQIESPGKVVQGGGSCRVSLGPDPENELVSPELLAPLRRASVKVDYFSDPHPEIWTKFVLIAGFGMTAVFYKRTVGEILDSQDSLGTVKAILSEATQIALKLGIQLPVDTEAAALAKGSSFPPDTKTSFQRDYETGIGRDERDSFAGSLIRLGIQSGVPTPETEKIFRSFHRPGISL